MSRPPGYLLNSVAARHFLGRRTQTWLAQTVGISTAQLSELLAGANGATLDQANRIALVLDVDARILFPELVEFSTTVRHFTAPVL